MGPETTDDETLGRVVQLDAFIVDPSPYADRLPGRFDDASCSELRSSIEEGGQMLPILVRPSGRRYLCVYGHRRLAVARELGRPVMAIVRELTPEEAAERQGVENGKRAGLSFYEKSIFAHSLDKDRIPRPTIALALGTDEQMVARMIRVADSVPSDLVETIGDLSRYGRPAWLSLADAMHPKKRAEETAILKRAYKVSKTTRYREASGRERFQMLLAAATGTPSYPKIQTVEAADGRPMATVSVSRGGTTLKLKPEFAAFAMQLGDRLPELLEQWRRDGSASRASST